MPSYKDRINEFREGKPLIRLSHPVRDRADAICDACGSAEDTASARITFGTDLVIPANTGSPYLSI